MATANINPTQATNLSTNLFGSATLAGFRNQTTALQIDTTPDAQNTGGTQIQSVNFFGTKYYGRCLLSDYDLSGLPAGATITGLVIKLYGTADSPGMDTGQVIFLEGTFGSTIATSDLDSFTGFTSGWDDSDVTEYSDAYGGDDWTLDAYNDITLNSDAVSAANTQFAAGNRFKMFGMEYEHWYSNDDFSLAAGKHINWVANPGATNEMVLVVTYDEAAATDLLSGPLKLNGGRLSILGGRLVIK